MPENIRSIRQKWRMSQDEFAELMGIDGDRRSAVISNYENRKANPSIEFMVKLQRMTNINIDELVYKKLDESQLPDQPIKPYPTMESYPEIPKFNEPEQEEIESLFNYKLMVQKIIDLENDIQALKEQIKVLKAIIQNRKP